MTSEEPTTDSGTTAVLDRQLATLGVAVRASAASHRGDLGALRRRRHAQRRRRVVAVAAVVATIVAAAAATTVVLSRRTPGATNVLTAPPSPTSGSASLTASSLPQSPPPPPPSSLSPTGGDCTTTGGFTTHIVENLTVVGDFKFVLVGEEHFLRWASGEPRCHREAEVQSLDSTQPLVGLLTAHHRDSTRQLTFPAGMDALLVDLGPSDYVLGGAVQAQRTPTDQPDEHRCSAEQSYVRTELPAQTRWVCLVEADFGVVTIDGPDRARIEAFVAAADLRSLLGG